MVKLFLQNKKMFITLCFMGIFPLCLPGAARETETMRDLTKLEEQLLDHEGYKRHAYKCPAGKLTVGIGRNLEDKGLSFDEALYLLRNDIEECVLDLYKIFAGFATFSKDRQRALIELRFILGPIGFRKFEKMIAAIKQGDFNVAASEMVTSLWFYQVKSKRAGQMYDMMLGDEDPESEKEFQARTRQGSIMK